MKTIIKIAGKSIKWYLFACMAGLAYVGLSHELKHLAETKCGVIETNKWGFDEADENFRYYWKNC